jgi:acyl-CoA thioesterase YciA
MAQSEAYPAIRVIMMPRDTNPQGTIFGGVILSYIDQAGAIEARRHTAMRFVTVALDGVVFNQPVFVGDVLSFYASLLSIGRTSMKIRVHVEAQRFDDPSRIVPVTEATLVYVAIDENRRPVPIVRESP